MALGLLADYDSNAVIGRALLDCDRGVRLLADNAIRCVWHRFGTPAQQQLLERIVEQNAKQRYEESIRLATELIQEVAPFAEAWNQRAIAYYCLGRYAESIHDCHQALEMNPYHFGAAAGLGQCYLRLGDPVSAIECFERALRLNPDLEGVRASVIYLRRELKRR